MFVLSFRPRSAPVASVVGGVLVLLLSGTPVGAQTQPPPVGSSVAAPSAPVQPLSPPPPPPPAVSLPPAALDAPRPTEGYPTVEAQPAPAPATPLYKKWWFWTAIGAFAVTTVVIIAASSGSGPPQTELGNMSAF